MFNITLLSLNIFTLSSASPFYAIHGHYQSQISTFILNSRFQKSFTHFIYSNTNFHQTIIKNDIFSYSLSSAILFAGNEEENLKSTIIRNKEIKNSIHYKDVSQNGNLIIATCIFKKCHTDEFGGGIFIEQNCSVTMHELVFDQCSAKSGGGGYICSQQRQVGDHGAFSDLSLIKVDVQYCCFQECSTKNNDEEKTGYGSALVLAGQTVILFYASTVDCYYTDTNGVKQKVTGAQFDIQSTNVSSEYVNATGGYSKYCGSIEYRYSGVGFFRYQTIMKMECMFVIAFSNFSTPSISITFCNLIENKLCDFDEKALTYPSMMKIVATDLSISNFVFYDNVFNKDGRLVSRDLQSNPSDTKYNDQKITLHNCYCNNYPNRQNDVFDTIDCELNKNSGLTLNPIGLLKLDKCEGEITAPTLVITSIFTPSVEFSSSPKFSNSKSFTFSDVFSKSDPFSKTQDFSKSKPFSESSKFSKTRGFSETSDFTSSKRFTNSNQFSESFKFTGSAEFSSSAKFSHSKVFSESSHFSKSNDFSGSKEFSKSSHFSKSNDFSGSKEFSKSSHFSKSNDFSATKEFSESSHFSKSNDFSGTKEFSRTAGFSQSDEFTQSNVFTKSDNFDRTKKFTKSDEFTKSNMFTKSDEFTKSNMFTKSDEFTKSNVFTKSDIFSRTKEFTKSDEFTKSNVFTKSDEFTRSSDFTESSSFTASLSFIPSDTFSMSKSFSESQHFSSSKEPLIPVIPNESKKERKINPGAIAGMAAGGAAVIAIIAVVIFFIRKKRMSMPEVDIDALDESLVSTTNENPIYDVNGEDDPFRDDFINN